MKQRDTPAPIRRCANPACGRPFSATARHTRGPKGEITWSTHCCRGCARAHFVILNQGKPLTAAIVGKQAKAHQRRLARFAEAFGELSPRDHAIIAQAEAWGRLTGSQHRRRAAERKARA